MNHTAIIHFLDDSRPDDWSVGLPLAVLDETELGADVTIAPVYEEDGRERLRDDAELAEWARSIEQLEGVAEVEVRDARRWALMDITSGDWHQLDEDAQILVWEYPGGNDASAYSDQYTMIEAGEISDDLEIIGEDGSRSGGLLRLEHATPQEAAELCASRRADNSHGRHAWVLDEGSGIWCASLVCEDSTGARIRTARQHAGFSRGDMAGALGVTYDTVLKWERGERSPNPSAARMILSLLGVEVIASSKERPRSVSVHVVAGRAKHRLAGMLSDIRTCGEMLDTRWAALIEALGYRPTPDAPFWGLTREGRLDSIDGRRVAIESRGDFWRVAIEGHAREVAEIMRKLNE